MNNKEMYIEVMSNIQPSEDVIERIMDMTNQKKKIMPRKSLVTVLIVVALLAFGGITANAATDGEVANYISNTVQVLINGKEANSTISKDDNGNDHIKIDGDIQNGSNEIVVKNEKNETEDVLHYNINFGDDYVSWGSDSSKTIEADNFQEPTTSIQK